MSINRKRGTIIIILLLVFIAIYLYYENNALTLTTLEIKSEKIPEDFDGFSVVQISDLHNASFGKDNAKLTEMISQADPDIIVFTGDIFDSRHTDVNVSVSLVKKCTEIADCYYVTGNHEYRCPEALEQFIDGASTADNFYWLDDSSLKLKRGESYITLMGVNDPTSNFNPDEPADIDEIMTESLNNIVTESDGYSILLSHRPEFAEVYGSFDIDLVLTGHAHGGQIRLPFIGGLIAPGQGYFPKWTSGVYDISTTSLVVSRGLGNSIFPFRIGNRPEVVTLVFRAVKE